MYKRLLPTNFPPKSSCFVFGARQCGKTTLLKTLDYILYIDLLDAEYLIEYSAKPNTLYKKISSLLHKSGYIIIDEIQKLPGLLDEVQRCIDNFPDIHFILSGSSARKLKRDGANLLGGRALSYTLHPLTAYEIGEDFSIDDAISQGTLPRIVTTLKKGESELAKDFLRSYVRTYLKEEIKEEALVRRLDSFQRFLEVAAGQSSQEINLSLIAEEALISLPTARGYFSILEDTLIGRTLTPWSKSIRKELAKTPKFYLFDCGVTRALQGLLSSPPSNIEAGHLFEQWVVNEVQNLNLYLKKDLKIHFWKTTRGAEVDIVIARGQKIIMGIECKKTKYPNKRDISGLEALREEYKDVKTVICAPVEYSSNITDKVEVVSPGQLYEIIGGL